MSMKKKINQIQLNPRQRNVSNLCDVHILKDLADLTADYDYYIEGKSQVIDNDIAITCIDQLPDGRIVYETVDDRLKIWNLRTGICDYVSNESRLHMFLIPMTRDGKIFFCTGKGNIKLWDPETDVLKDICAEYTFHNMIHFVIDLLDGRIAAGGFDNQIKIININTGVVERIVYQYGAVFCEPLLNESSSNCIERIVCAGMDDLKIWNVNSGVCEFYLDCNVICLKILPNRKICCGMYNGDSSPD
jgi:WD40 repeat protein